ncbi:nose resistant to fluoxetine protein 6-like [Helicoverpa armigera]|uniref:nose resistant to fluoxetine protein 6-like n=1 Tax=Helicoverpa armigera TaxID=29058 RepID=UPI003083B4A1
MKVLSVILLYFISISLAKTLPNKDVTVVDIVISGLKEQVWSDDEGPCLEHTLLILENVRNYTVWAVWIWNSMHHPTGTFIGSEYSLGNYDQCLNAPSNTADPNIVTQYCLAEVKLTSKQNGGGKSMLGSTEDYVSTKTEIGRDFNKITWGTCLPSTCKAESVSKILKAMYLANPLTSSDSEIVVDSCEVAGREVEYSFEFYAFMILITMLVLTSFISTYLQPSITKSGALKGIIEAFSLKRNWNSLTKPSSDEIGILNFTKVFQASFAVATHTAFFEVTGPISNGVHFDKLMLETKNPIKNALKHIDIPVDNFFLISGLLLMKGFMEKKKKPLVGLVNRYFRLTASFAVIIFYVAAVSIYTGDGPVWQKFASREQQACSDNWWLGLLMLNNYINSENICLIVSWYIPCDYQLAVMGTILYLLWEKNKTMGKVVTTITAVLAVLLPGVITYWRKLPGLILFHNLEKILDFRKNEVYLDTYIRSHNRAGPYLIGMAMGYIMSVYKPETHRNVISKDRSILLFSLATIVIYKVLTDPLSWVSLEYDHVTSAVFTAYSRNVWALAYCIIIGVVEYGNAATIRKFTGWHGFTILGRLVYGVYLTHSVILQQNRFSRRNLQQFDLIYSESLHSFGVMVVSTIMATLLWLFVEAPLNNIVNLVINKRSKNQNNQSTREDTETSHLRKTDLNIKRS